MNKHSGGYRYSIKEVYRFIQSDCIRYLEKYSLSNMACFYFKDSTFRFQVAFRMSQGRGITKLIGDVFYKFSRVKKRIYLGKETKVGYGLYIGHGGPIIINPTTVIGNNCNLSQFTTIGSNENHAAVIGDNVYIGPNVCIVEDVHIGNNVTIGAGSVVTKDIPDNATAAGNYAKVLNYNNPGRYITRRWPMEWGILVNKR